MLQSSCDTAYASAREEAGKQKWAAATTSQQERVVHGGVLGCSGAKAELVRSGLGEEYRM